MDPIPEGYRDCGIVPGSRITLTGDAAETLSGCYIPVGAILTFSYNEEKIMDNVAVEQTTTHDVAPVETPETALPAIIPEAQAQSLPVESIEAPAAVPDISQLEGLAGGNPLLMVVLAVLVLGGGTAGWKFWNKLSEQKHEQAMKKMEIASQQAGLQGAQPPPCQAATAEMKKEIAALESKLSKLERQAKALSASASFDEDEFEKRLLKKIDDKLKKSATPK